MIPTPDGLTRTERRVWRAFDSGTRVTLGTDRPGRDDPERTVRAEVLVTLLRRPDDPGADRVAAVRLRGAYITGRIDLAGATVQWLLSLYNCVLEEPPDFSHTTTRTVKINHSELPGLAAIWSHIGGHLTIAESTVNGSVELVGAHISGELRMNNAHIRAGLRPAVTAGGITVEGGCYGSGMRTEGALRFAGARLEGGFVLTGARLEKHVENSDDTVLHLDNAEINNALRCDHGFSSTGRIRLRGARVSGDVSFRRASRMSAPRTAIHATRLAADDLDLRTETPIEGVLHLEDARIGALSDDSRTWPAAIRLTGMTYETIRYWSQPEAVKQRLDWLSRDPNGFRPQPYEQLAAYYRRTGRDDLARAVLYAEERRRPRRHAGARIFALVLEYTVGYGYQPARAAYWLAALLAVGAVGFAVHHPAPLKPDEAPHFNPVLYSLDLLSPIGGLGQRDAFDPTGGWQWLAGLLVVAGWVLATALIAGVGRVYNRM